MEKMRLKDVCEQRSRTLRSYSVEGKPLRVWKNEDHFILVHEEAVVKLDAEDEDEFTDTDESSTLYKPKKSARILDARPANSYIYILEIRENKMKISSLKSDGSIDDILLTNALVHWNLTIQGEFLNDNFFVDHKLKNELHRKEQLMILWCNQPILIQKDKAYPLQGASELSRSGFIIKYLNTQPTFNIDRFTDILHYVGHRKDLKGTLADVHIKEIAVSAKGNCIVVLVEEDLWLYNRLEKFHIMEKVCNFTLKDDILTVLTKDLRLYTQNVEDCSDQVPKRPAIGDSTLKDIYRMSRLIQQTGVEIANERRKLNQLTFFSKLANKIDLFQVNYKVQVNELRPDTVVNLTLDLKLNHSDSVIDHGFFALKICVKTRHWNYDKTVKLTSLRSQQTLSCDIPLPRIESDDFPLELAGNLVLLEDSISEKSSGFLFSEKVFENELSPFMFLKQKLSPVNNSTAFTDISERAKFLSLLDEVDEVRKRKVKKKMKIASDQLENNQNEVLNDLLKSPGEGRLFSFLGQDLGLEIVKSTNDTVNTVTITGSNKAVSIFLTYLTKYFVRS